MTDRGKDGVSPVEGAGELFLYPSEADITSADFPDWEHDVSPELKPRYERVVGAMEGLAVGDALGAQVEFKAPGSFEPVTRMRGGGPHEINDGEWTDDMSLAMCMAISLVKKKGFDTNDQGRRYLKWWRSGYLGSNGRCFDIGNQTKASLLNFEKTGSKVSHINDRQYAGNGSLMRLAPTPLFFAPWPMQAIEKSGESSLITHASLPTVDACRYFGGLLVGAVSGASKEELLSSDYAPVTNYWRDNQLDLEIREIARGSFKHREPPEIVASGHVVRTLEAALWAFYNSNSFKEGCLKAVNLGDDADTVGAVYGQIAGAYYGAGGVPEEWRQTVARRDIIDRTAKQLFFDSLKQSEGK